MTRRELIKNISAKTSISRQSCDKVITALAEEIKDCLVAGDKVLISGFMSFETTERAGGKRRNPLTGMVEEYPASKTIKCKMSKTIKDEINMK